jgi:hypothetical protein
LLIWKWRVQHRKLKLRLAGSNEWLQFKGAMAAQKLMNGAGSSNVD